MTLGPDDEPEPDREEWHCQDCGYKDEQICNLQTAVNRLQAENEQLRKDLTEERKQAGRDERDAYHQGRMDAALDRGEM